jgi:hypothetical protein
MTTNVKTVEEKDRLQEVDEDADLIAELRGRTPAEQTQHRQDMDPYHDGRLDEDSVELDYSELQSALEEIGKVVIVDRWAYYPEYPEWWLIFAVKCPEGGTEIAPSDHILVLSWALDYAYEQDYRCFEVLITPGGNGGLAIHGAPGTNPDLVAAYVRQAHQVLQECLVQYMVRVFKAAGLVKDDGDEADENQQTMT